MNIPVGGLSLRGDASESANASLMKPLARLSYCASQRQSPYCGSKPAAARKGTKRQLITIMIPFLTQHRQRWKTGAYSWHRIPWPNPGLGLAFTHLTEVGEFGSNPGAL